VLNVYIAAFVVMWCYRLKAYVASPPLPFGSRKQLKLHTLPGAGWDLGGLVPFVGVWCSVAMVKPECLLAPVVFMAW
jgi:hypothetical protein